ncbi:putative serine protease 46 [Dasypus novemcinctus]|uniref:putative serine protease 46 n=1 Tax=Dasypus novemcinctus TaxID=9361 RepID=UPI00265EAA73|nr:putative serine protease 46 [Dasypus novemcinctus]
MAGGLGSLQSLTKAPLTTVRFGEQPYAEELLFQGCGQAEPACRSVKGKLVEENKWPWQVSLLFLGVHICSGTLIHQQWVLTAAHCLHRSWNSSEYSVKVGVQKLPNNGTQLPLSHIVIHEKFSNLLSQDIALLKLQAPISWSREVKPVCLPNAKFKLTVGTTCWVTGWEEPKGQAPAKDPSRLQEVAVRIQKNRFCNRQYRYLLSRGQKFISSDMLCASSEWGMNSCKGESGSPLVCQVNRTWIQVGVVSWSFSCRQRRFPGVYTSTAHFSQWIRGQVSEKRVLGSAGAALLAAFLPCCLPLVSWASPWLL